MSIERDVLDRLERLGIRHFVTGSWALSVHAEPRMTRDLDLVIDLDKADYEPLIRPAFEDVYLVNDLIDLGCAARVDHGAPPVGMARRHLDRVPATLSQVR